MTETDVDYATIVGGQESRGKATPTAFHQSVGSELCEAQTLFVKSVDEPNRRITALASTESIDRHGEIILASAFKELLPIYMKNPVVITSHQHRLSTGHSSTVANVVEARIDKSGLFVIIEFVQGTVLGDEYWLLYSQKKQRALSVGFMPLEGKQEERDGKLVWVHTKVELLEISCVPVGSNRESLSRSKQRREGFVADKQEEREEAKLMAEIEADFPDEDCRAFAEALLRGEYEIRDDDGECEESNTYRKAISGEAGDVCIEENEFVSLVSGDSACGFADMVRL